MDPISFEFLSFRTFDRSRRSRRGDAKPRETVFHVHLTSPDRNVSIQTRLNRTSAFRHRCDASKRTEKHSPTPPSKGECFPLRGKEKLGCFDERRSWDASNEGGSGGRRDVKRPTKIDLSVGSLSRFLVFSFCAFRRRIDSSSAGMNFLVSPTSGSGRPPAAVAHSPPTSAPRRHPLSSF